MASPPLCVAGSGSESGGTDHVASPSIPSGTASAPTRILGAGWDSGCSAPPELWGSEHAAQVFTLNRSSYVTIGCLEITDHSSCIEFHNGSPGAA